MSASPRLHARSAKLTAEPGPTRAAYLEVNMIRHADVGIVGAGPAGARAAELLAKEGRSVVLLDPKAPWEKPCGGGLTPSAFDRIPELDSLRSKTRPVSRVRIETGAEEGFTVHLERPMRVVSRLALSQWQLERALLAGAVHLPARVRRLWRGFDGWHLDTDGGMIRVPFLVGADGAASIVRRAAAPKFRVELAPTRVAFPGDAGPTPDTAILRFYPQIAGYLWDFPRTDHRSVGIGVPNGTWRRLRLDGEIDGHRDSSEPCACPGLSRAGAVIGTAQLGHGDYTRIAGDDFALLGDAAGLADPLTGEGIQNAMISAGLLVEAMLDDDIRAYARRAYREFEREFEISRIVRRHVFESEAGMQLIGKGLTTKWGYASIAAVVNAVNEHDGHPLRLLGRWLTARRALTADPATAMRSSRLPVPCACTREAPGAEGRCHQIVAAA